MGNWRWLGIVNRLSSSLDRLYLLLIVYNIFSISVRAISPIVQLISTLRAGVCVCECVFHCFKIKYFTTIMAVVRKL